jgi:hypothetical protein
MNPFIGVDSVGLGNESFNFDSYYEQVKTNSLNTIKNEINHDIIAKHNWHLNYLENIKSMIHNFRKIPEQELSEYSNRGL